MKKATSFNPGKERNIEGDCHVFFEQTLQCHEPDKRKVVTENTSRAGEDSQFSTPFIIIITNNLN